MQIIPIQNRCGCCVADPLTLPPIDKPSPIEAPCQEPDRYEPPPPRGISVPSELQAKIYHFDAKTLREVGKVNAKLEEKGLAPVNIAAVTQEIEEISNDPALSNKEKRKQINDVRKKLGLSKGEMKRLFTKRLEKIYGAMIAELKATGQANEPLLRRLEQNHKLYSSMYKPGGCIKKVFKGIGGFFKGITGTIFNFAKGIFDPRNWFRPSFWRDVVAPAVLNLVPNIGPALSRAYLWGLSVYRTGKQLIQNGLALYRIVVGGPR